MDGFTGPSCVPVAEAAVEAQHRAIVAEHAKSVKINAMDTNSLSRAGGRGISIVVLVAFVLVALLGAVILVGCRFWQRHQQPKAKLPIEAELGEASTAAVAFLG